MAVPDYQTIMLPFLKDIEDQKEHQFRGIIESLAVKFHLTEDERKELLPSGKIRLFDNRVGWAKTYLKKAGLVDYPRRAVVVITQRGVEFLKSKPQQIDNRVLSQFSEFLEFINIQQSNSIEKAVSAEPEMQKQTPEEILEGGYLRLRKSLAQELIKRIIELPPSFFEKLVVELLVKMGYGGSIKDAGKAIGKSGDEGIDGTIKEDKLGLDIIYIQAKRWDFSNKVGRPEIQKFVGALAGQGAKKGIFITTSSFTPEALEYTPKNETKIVLINGEDLTQLMIDYNPGVTSQQTYEIKKIDSDYFEEE